MPFLSRPIQCCYQYDHTTKDFIMPATPSHNRHCHTFSAFFPFVSFNLFIESECHHDEIAQLYHTHTYQQMVFMPLIFIGRLPIIKIHLTTNVFLIHIFFCLLLSRTTSNITPYQYRCFYVLYRINFYKTTLAVFTNFFLVDGIH